MRAPGRGQDLPQWGRCSDRKAAILVETRLVCSPAPPTGRSQSAVFSELRKETGIRVKGRDQSSLGGARSIGAEEGGVFDRTVRHLAVWSGLFQAV